MSAPTDEFRGIYVALAAAVVAEASERGVRAPFLRDPSLADSSALGVSRAALLGIADDEVFLANCYLVLLDRSPSPEEMVPRLSRLKRGEIDRDRVLEEIIGSKQFVSSGHAVVFT